MFIAKFNQVSGVSTKFTPDADGQMPYIGTVLAGTSTGSLLLASLFDSNKMLPNVPYVCKNVIVEAEGRDGVRRTYSNLVIVGLMKDLTNKDIFDMELQLGPGRLVAYTPVEVKVTDGAELQ